MFITSQKAPFTTKDTKATKEKDFQQERET